ncbi:MAG: inner membrane protein [Eubacteriales bacterium]|nr:inner membrane protein [Eubacteriales bacterium]MDN5363812.1 inner membrane protein [Eubacteriales bacterium]
MDPVTHLVAGMAIAITAAEYIPPGGAGLAAVLIGSLFPDLDIVLQAGGDLFYLRHHRGFSHSLLGLFLFAGIIAAMLTIVFPGVSFFALWQAAGLGYLGHILFDLGNSYGVQLLWPFTRKKITFNLLMLFDPLLLLFLSIAFLKPIIGAFAPYFAWGMTVGYLVCRYVLRVRAEKFLRQKFAKRAQKIFVTPALDSLFGWDFLVEKEEEVTYGHYRSLGSGVGLRGRLKKEKSNPVIEAALNSPLGRFFRDFTPCFHISCWRDEEHYVVRFQDLRYFFREGFLHTATVIMDRNRSLKEAVVSFYRGRRRVQLWPSREADEERQISG